MQWQLYPIDQFDNFVEAWDRLNKAAGNTPLLDSDFVAPLLHYFANGKEKVAVCGDLSDPAALAIINKTKTGAWSTFQPSQAPIGPWLQRRDQSLETLTGSLRRKIPGFVMVFSVTQQDPDLLARPNNSRNFKTLDYIETARVTVDGTFDEYWSARGKNLRQNLRRQRNRLNREKINIQLKVIEKEDQVYNCVKSYGELESAGWKSERNTAIHIDNAQGRFYRDMMERFCRKNQGIIYQYLYNEALAATDLCIKCDEQMVILKTTYDESITNTSPAMLMREEAFREIFQRKSTGSIEFYGRVMDWHRKWSDEIRSMYHTNSFAPLYHILRS